MSCVLVYERDFEGALAAANKTVALAPYDTYMRSRLIMVLSTSWSDRIRRFSGLTRLRRGIRRSVGFSNHRRGLGVSGNREICEAAAGADAN